LNPHALAGTSPSSWRVCLFRHSDVVRVATVLAPLRPIRSELATIGCRYAPDRGEFGGGVTSVAGEAAAAVFEVADTEAELFEEAAGDGRRLEQLGEAVGVAWWCGR
jgi:hypothetical protein